MKKRNKGKVHPFTSSSSSSYTPNGDAFPVLKLLPAAILTLVSVLSPDDRQVLAYMITRSLKSSNPEFLPAEEKKSCSRKRCSDGHGHKAPALFDCDCFHCYTSFWFRWDSSPNRELIHQAIEAFEDHLNNGEEFKKSTGNGKRRRKEKIGRRKSDEVSGGGSGVLEFRAVESPGNQEGVVGVVPESQVAAEEVADERAKGVAEDDYPAAPVMAVGSHKGLARKMLPDVMGIFSSRLWSLWSPNV